MLAFITSLRHPDNATDYARTEELLRETLRSIEAQTSGDYIVVVVANRPLTFELPPKMHFVQVDYEPPAPANGPHADRTGFVRDKGSKVGAGLIAASQFAPDTVMIFDADDYLHRDLVSFVSAHPSEPGWVVRDGWVYSRQRNGYRKQKEFNETCGTCYVVPFSAYAVPTDISATAPQDEIIAGYGEVLPNIMGAHRNALSWHRARGRHMRPLPFRAAVYHVDTGDNHSGKVLTGVIRPWDRKLAEGFAVASTMPALRTFLSCFSPRAVVETFADIGRRGVRKVSRRLRGTAAGT